MSYHDLEDFRRKAGTRGDAQHVIGMIETYDPKTQMVVMAAIDGQNPVTMKVRLDALPLMDEPGGVH